MLPANPHSHGVRGQALFGCSNNLRAGARGIVNSDGLEMDASLILPLLTYAFPILFTLYCSPSPGGHWR